MNFLFNYLLIELGEPWTLNFIQFFELLTDRSKFEFREIFVKILRNILPRLIDYCIPTVSIVIFWIG